MSTRVIQVTKVLQAANDRYRYEVLVRWQERQSFVDAMRSKRLVCRWHVRQHLQPGEGVRAAIPPARRQKAAVELKSFPVVQWNINGLRLKRTDLQLFLKVNNPAVLALGETRRTEASWRLNLPGYACLETVCNDRSKGEQGVALAVRSDFSVSEVGDKSPYWVFGRVVGGGLHAPIITGSVYMPHQRDPRRACWKSLKAMVRKWLEKDPGTRMIVMGGLELSAGANDGAGG